jgi:hypothetical protein
MGGGRSERSERCRTHSRKSLTKRSTEEGGECAPRTSFQTSAVSTWNEPYVDATPYVELHFVDAGPIPPLFGRPLHDRASIPDNHTCGNRRSGHPSSDICCSAVYTLTFASLRKTVAALFSQNELGADSLFLCYAISTMDGHILGADGPLCRRPGCSLHALHRCSGLPCRDHPD